ncbi:MAG: glycosyltransferase family 4 protein [Clostridia bacterium]|nr:glycosyltransferase family 4 protein [Clostridia bacterium]
MKICMAAPYDIKDRLSWSGTPLSLYSALSDFSENEVTTLKLSDYHTQINTKINMLSHCDVKNSIKNRALTSKLGPSVMNPLNSKILRKHCNKNDYDALIEFGGFQPSDNLPPYYVYTDASHDLALDYYNQYGYLPFGSENNSVKSVKRAADYVRKIYQNAQGVLCMSQWLADSMINTTGVDPKKVHAVYAGANWHGVNLPDNIKSKNIAGNNEIHLVLTGVSYERKGVDLAIKANEILNNNSDKKFYLHICGIKTEFEHDEFVINHGFVNKQQLIEILNKCDLFVLPSRFDCFGISFVEAMTFGLPCIGRKICAMPEIIDEGINGELISKDDPKELADLISKICLNESLYASYSENAIKKAKKFTWENVAQNIMNILR